MNLVLRLSNPLVHLSRSKIIYSNVQLVLINSDRTFLKRNLSVSGIESASSAEVKAVWGSSKAQRKVKLNFPIDIVANPQSEIILEPLRIAVKEQVKWIGVKSLLVNQSWMLLLWFSGWFGTKIKRK